MPPFLDTLREAVAELAAGTISEADVDENLSFLKYSGLPTKPLHM